MALRNINISIIISTYNTQEWLEKVIYGFSRQSERNFEIIVADDGSDSRTEALVTSLRQKFDIPLYHVWQEDDGFQKSRILNKAILACHADYLIFTDGDCIPREDFVAAHWENRETGYFLSGGYFMLPLEISQTISIEDIVLQNCFDIKWLQAHGLKNSFKNLKLSSKGFIAKLLNAFTPTKPTWNGHNSSGWKSDLMAVNGFNEEMQYGGQDRELGERLFNNGLKSKQIRYSAICVHLDHPRGYVSADSWKKNFAIRKQVRVNKTIRTHSGIEKITR